MSSMITRETTVCFTGHRTEKLPDCGDENSPVTKAIKSLLYKAVSDCIDSGCRCFVTGLARGIDLWAGEIVLDQKARGKDVRLTAVFPYRSHGSSFKGYDKWALGNIVHEADEIVYASEEYTPYCMKKRNEYMVNRSGKIIAVVSDYRSGTGQTIRLAEKAGLDVILIDAAEISRQSEKYKDSSFNVL